MSERTELTAKHREEWQHFRKNHLDPCLANYDDEAMKTLKTIADSLRIVQEAERRAVLFGEGQESDGPIEIEWGC